MPGQQPCGFLILPEGEAAPLLQLWHAAHQRKYLLKVSSVVMPMSIFSYRCIATETLTNISIDYYCCFNPQGCLSPRDYNMLLYLMQCWS
jgi:hypothetical protein